MSKVFQNCPRFWLSFVNSNNWKLLSFFIMLVVGHLFEVIFWIFALVRLSSVLCQFSGSSSFLKYWSHWFIPGLRRLTPMVMSVELLFPCGQCGLVALLSIGCPVGQVMSSWSSFCQVFVKCHVLFCQVRVKFSSVMCQVQ